MRKLFALLLAVLAPASLMLVLAGPAEAQVAPEDIVSLTGCINQEMGPGATGDCVLSLQHSLAAIGVGITEDGQYGEQTRLAVLAFQSSHGLTKDGVSGPETTAAIDRAANSPLPPNTSTGTVAPARPNGAVTDYGVLQCSKLVLCGFTLTRPLTKEVNDGINSPTGTGVSGLAGIAACHKAGPDPRVGLACDLLVVAGDVALNKVAGDAVKRNGCIKAKWIDGGEQLGDLFRGLSVDTGRNCIG